MKTRRRLMQLCVVAVGMLLGTTTSAQDGQRTVDLTIDAVTGRLIPDHGGGGGLRYWADPERNAIMRHDSDSLGAQTVADGLNLPYGLGFDRDTQTLIWTSSGDETMQAMPLDGGEVRSLTSNFEDPPVIELPFEGGRQAITVLDGAVLRVTVDADTDARHDDVLYMLPDGAVVIGLALDTQTNQLYVGNAVGMAAYKVDLVSGRADTLAFTDHVAPVPDPDFDHAPHADQGQQP